MRLSVNNVVVRFGKETILSGINLDFEGPGLVQILGPNGAGKTTLLRTILGLVKPVKGRVFVDGIDVTGKPEKAGAHIGYVPQALREEGIHRYPVSAWELVETEVMLRRKMIGLRISSEIRSSVIRALKLAGVNESLWDKSLWELSGGERQRVMIARALVHDPAIVLMDEPLSPIDPPGRVMLAETIACLSQKKLVVITSHDPTLLLQHTKYVVLLNRDICIAGPPDKVLTIDNARKIYGEAAVAVNEYHIHISDSVCKR